MKINITKKQYETLIKAVDAGSVVEEYDNETFWHELERRLANYRTISINL